MKFIGILGTSYCGSTLLSHMLGRCQNVFNIGESHWVFEKDRKYKNSNNFIYCGIHGKKCTFWNERLFDKISQENNIIPATTKALQLYGTDIFILSDKNKKNYSFLEEKGILLNKAIFLLKSPEQFVASCLRKNTTGEKRNILLHLKQYMTINTSNLDYLEKRNIEYIKVIHDELTGNVVSVMTKVCNFCGIEVCKEMFVLNHKTEKSHVIAGSAVVNSSVKGKFLIGNALLNNCSQESQNWYKRASNCIIKDEKYQLELSDNEKIIIKNSDARKLYDKILQENIK